MHALVSVLKDFKLFFNIQTKKGRVRLAVLLIIFAMIALFVRPSADMDGVTSQQARAVTTAAVHTFSDATSAQLIGSVTSVNQAVIQSEASGRVTSVEVVLGQRVSAGQVIARLENAGAYAAMLQAEGLYEGALASSQISDMSVVAAENNFTSARTSAYAAYTSAYSVLQDIYQSDLDLIVADPNNVYHTPGLSLIRTASVINEVEDQFEEVGVLLSKDRVAESAAYPISVLLADAQAATSLTLRLINNLQFLITDNDVRKTYDATESTYLSSLSTAQSKVDALVLSLQTADISLTAAQTALEKAQLGGTLGEVSSANAQVKQALGSLKAAQANYNKTVLRSPIDGVVNAVHSRTGDFMSAFETIVEIANNDALEVVTYVGQSDRDIIAAQQEVLIEGGIPGVISTIAPAVNPATGKIEVRIQSASPDLVNGDVVTIALGTQADQDMENVLQVPLTAVKFTATAGVVFTVEDEVLVSHTVEIGSVHDAYIEIMSGVTAYMEIVVDARGLSAGERVSALTS